MLDFAVVGNPVSHSKSPLIHRLFAAQANIQLTYGCEEVEPDRFDEFVKGFFAGGGKGLNITVPFKENAFRLASWHSARAQQARAVNTLYLDEQNRLCGDNTDGIGLVRDLRDNQQVTIQNKRILVMGAGGAVRGVLGNLAGEAPRSITLVNRTEAKAHKLREEFDTSVAFEVTTFDTQVDQPYDVIINGTSSGLNGKVPPLSPQAVGSKTSCYDMMYADQDTAFVKWAKNAGAMRALDGLGMLVEQAAESFSIWHNCRPDTSPVIEQVRSSLAENK